MTVQLLDGPHAGTLTDLIGPDLVIEVDGDLYYRAEVRERSSYYRHVGPRPEVVDLFAGPGGWDLAARDLGIEPLGIEFDDAACATRRAAGLWTLQGDVAEVDPRVFAGLVGLIASPPCQAWSNAGKRLGLIDRPHVIACARELAAGRDTRAAHGELCVDPRSMLVVEPLRWALELKPRWVTLEQVPPVIELWDLFADLLRDVGYSCWTGKLEAERYGVPQTRERAILIARLDGPARPPEPTHQRYVKGQPARHEVTLEGEVLPWVSMAEALGWGMTERPSVTVPSAGSSGGGPRPLDGGSGARETLREARAAGAWLDPGATVRTGTNSMSANRDLDEMVPYERPVTAPAPTVDAKTARAWTVGVHDDGVPWSERRHFRQGNRDKAVTRTLDEPAPTLLFGHALNSVEWVEGDPPPPPARDGEAAADADEALRAAGQAQLLDESAGPVANGDTSTEALDDTSPEARGDGWPHERPATTVAGDARVFAPGAHVSAAHRGDAKPRSEGAIRVTLPEALILQTFPPDYPLQGNQTKCYEQVGNAVPPLLARPVLEAAS